MMSDRAGLSMDPGSKVTYNGVEIGRVGQRRAGHRRRQPRAKITLDVDPKYINLIPANVDAEIKRHHGVRQQVHLLLVAERSGRRNASPRPT